jgi:hypothetical protein
MKYIKSKKKNKGKNNDLTSKEGGWTVRSRRQEDGGHSE